MLHLKSDEYVGTDCAIRIVERAPQPDYPEHRHDFSELILVSSGHGMHVVNGEQSLVLPNTLDCVSNQDYHLYADNQDVNLINILYKKEKLNIHPQSAEVINQLESGSRNFLINENAFNALYTLAQSLRSEQESTDQYAFHIQTLLFEQLLLNIARLRFEQYHNAPVINAIIYLGNNFKDNELSVSRICELFKVTPKVLNRKLHEMTGLTANKFINLLRWREAKLLLSKGRSITEVAMAIGYNDSNYFSTRFKSTFGLTPREYLKLQTGVSAC